MIDYSSAVLPGVFSSRRRRAMRNDGANPSAAGTQAF
jgi:hypothetical protein